MADVTTRWWCDSCGSMGAITMDAHTGVYEGFERILNAHDEAELCATGHDRVRVALVEDTTASTRTRGDQDG